MTQNFFINRRSLYVSLLLACFLLGPAACGGNGKIEEYSARQIFKDPAGREKTHNIFVSYGKMRMEMSSPRGEDSIVMIYRKDKEVAWTLFPEKKFYIENKLNEANLQKTFGKIPIDTNREDLGTETVNGFKCRKMCVKTTTHIMGREIESISTVWISDRLDFPVRSRTKDSGVMELRDVKPGRQPADFFEIPAGYTKRDMPFFDIEQMQKGSKSGARTPDLPFNCPKGLRIPFGQDE